ncbi:glycoside hydrolase family 97 protein [Candidatus Saccharibacteria bacterium]|nr:glycoside hydrolase family 97 protein [Candidatus Saccharibacteria bacterium]
MFKWAETKFSSPNGKIVVAFKLKGGCPYYSIAKDDQTIVHDSKMGFTAHGLTFKKQYNFQSKTRSHQEIIQLPWGETNKIPNIYKEKTVDLENLNIIFRVFDHAVAFRYELKPTAHLKRLSISDELTEFNIDPSSTSWSIPAYQPDRYEYNYEKKPLIALSSAVHTPLTVKTASHYLAIHEAALYDYGAMNLKVNDRGILKADITPLSDGTRAHLDLPFKTPWRLILIEDNAIGLITNYTMLALNEPPHSDFSWVRPLKFIGIWWAMYVGEWTWAPGPCHGATTAHAKEYIDAAASLGIKGLLIEGWNNGWEGDWLENGAATDFTTPDSDFDLPAVSRYAADRGVELVGHHETVGFVDNYEAQLEKAYNYYAAHGIHYIKTGYSGAKMIINGRAEYHHSQLGVKHYQKTLELAARKKIMLDVHEPIKGTGIERTFPNLLTREGARGQEYESGSISPSHACILPFTRLLAGGMDYTPGVFDLDNPKKPVYTTITRQLAYYVTIYSAMTMAADRPMFYEKYPDLFEFIKLCPLTFKQTIPLIGEIGKCYVVARESTAGDWFVGGITNESARTITLNFAFLPQGTFRVTIYQDAKDANYRTNPLAYEILHLKATSESTKNIYLAPGGGFAIHLQRQ